MIRCPKCGNEVSGDDFCSECGLKLNHTSKENKHYCPECGFETSIKDKFCSNCGTHELKATNQVGNNLVATFNPGTAFLISIYTTGAGHIYLGLFKRGISFLISQIVLVVLVAIFTLLLGYLWYMLAVIVLLLGILACLTLHIYSIYDSYKSIKKITNGESVEDIMFFNKFM